MPSPSLRAFLLCGPSLSGKSTAATLLAAEFDAAVISADEINASRGLPFGAEGLPESTWAETMRLEIEQLRTCARSGRSAVLDDTLCYRWLRDRFRKECVAAGLDPLLLLFAPPEEDLIRRHAAALLSKARPILSIDRLKDHLETFEWPTPEGCAIPFDSPSAIAAFLGSVR